MELMESKTKKIKTRSYTVEEFRKLLGLRNETILSIKRESRPIFGLEYTGVVVEIVLETEIK